MGLMFLFPASEEEKDRIDVRSNDRGEQIVLKTYGLPLIFWGYLGAALTVILAMFLAIKGPVERLLEMDDPLNKLIAYGVLFVLFTLPFSAICFFFYEKFIIKQNNELILQHRLFYGLFRIQKKYNLRDNDALEVRHFIDSPNVAKMKQDPTLRGFENKGYFELWGVDKNDKEFLIDKASRKVDLKRMKEILEKY